jgi:hypothetical protein
MLVIHIAYLTVNKDQNTCWHHCYCLSRPLVDSTPSVSEYDTLGLIKYLDHL